MSIGEEANHRLWLLFIFGLLLSGAVKLDEDEAAGEGGKHTDAWCFDWNGYMCMPCLSSWLWGPTVVVAEGWW